MESNGYNLFLRIRERVEKGLGHLFITKSDSYFFNKTNLKQHLFKNKNAIKMIEIYCKCLEKLNCVKINNMKGGLYCNSITLSQRSLLDLKIKVLLFLSTCTECSIYIFTDQSSMSNNSLLAAQ